MTDNRFNSSSSAKPPSGFSLLVGARMLQGSFWNHDLGTFDGALSLESLITNGHSGSCANQLRCLLECFGEYMAIVGVL